MWVCNLLYYIVFVDLFYTVLLHYDTIYIRIYIKIKNYILVETIAENNIDIMWFRIVNLAQFCYKP